VNSHLYSLVTIGHVISRDSRIGSLYPRLEGPGRVYYEFSGILEIIK